ncbi:hypothetical protein FH972_022408 [Carpinus fangiana]|uniref:Bromo domain-containing protein n=1 Tax=Carpinus fangiana TaxID=176857 RepID=A0A5N6KSI2_9ROSI|nr:hypothetical protein FH972_022408 [Carpinus fangiana]
MSDSLKEANQRLATVQESQKVAETNAAAQQSDNVTHALAGAGGGLLSMALTYPLITLSTRAQVESKRASTTVMGAVKQILDREGVAGLFAGIDSALFGITVTNFVYYYWYEWTRSALEQRALTQGRSSRKLTTLESMLAGAIAGSATVLSTNPIWVVNTRMTARKQEANGETLPGGKPKKAPSTLGTALKMIKEEGFTSLFAGVMPALVLVINPILQYTIFEQLKNVVEKRRKLGAYDSFYLGALGKLAATSITYPYLTVKSRAHVAGREGNKENMFQSFSRIRREEGWAGLYGGIGPKITQSVITTAFLFAFKDILYNAMVKARKNVGTANQRRNVVDLTEEDDNEMRERQHINLRSLSHETLQHWQPRKFPANPTLKPPQQRPQGWLVVRSTGHHSHHRPRLISSGSSTPTTSDRALQNANEEPHDVRQKQDLRAGENSPTNGHINTGPPVVSGSGLADWDPRLSILTTSTKGQGPLSAFPAGDSASFVIPGRDSLHPKVSFDETSLAYGPQAPKSIPKKSEIDPRIGIDIQDFRNETEMSLDDREDVQRLENASFSPCKINRTKETRPSTPPNRRRDESSGRDVEQRFSQISTINSDHEQASKRHQTSHKTNNDEHDNSTPIAKSYGPPDKNLRAADRSNSPGLEDLPRLFQLLSEMQNEWSARSFLKPVDKNRFPEYYNVIKQPMDLSTIEQDLDTGKYAQADMFLQKAMLIFHNCRAFNHEQSSYVKTANKLQSFMWGQVRKTPYWSHLIEKDYSSPPADILLSPSPPLPNVRGVGSKRHRDGSVKVSNLKTVTELPASRRNGSRNGHGILSKDCATDPNARERNDGTRRSCTQTEAKALRVKPVLDRAKQSGNPQTILLVSRMFSCIQNEPHSGRIRQGAWQADEEALLIHLKEELKLSWIKIGEYFPHRSSWHTLQHRYSIKLHKRTAEPIANEAKQNAVQGSESSTEVPPSRQIESSPLGLSSIQIPDGTRMEDVQHDQQKFDHLHRTARDNHPAISALAENKSDPSLAEPRALTASSSQTMESVVAVKSIRRSSVKHNNAVRRPQELDIFSATAIVSMKSRISSLRRDPNILRPYIPRLDREFLAQYPMLWNEHAASAWVGTTIHIDFINEELEAIEATTSAIRKLTVTDPSMPLRERVHTLLSGVSEVQALRITAKVLHDGSCFNRSHAAIESFLYDASDYDIEAKPVHMKLKPQQPEHSRLRYLRHRELDGRPIGTSYEEFDSLGPAFYFKECSSDVNVCAWAPNGDTFAIGSAAVSDIDSRDYNKQNNLLIGRMSDKTLFELPYHCTKRRTATQDSLLYQTISALQFSQDGQYLITTGYDKVARVWDVTQTPQVPVLHLAHDNLIDVLAVNSTGMLATGSSPGISSGLCNSGAEIRLFDCKDGVQNEVESIGMKLFASRRSNKLDPACLRFGCADNARHLLCGFSSRDKDYGDGEICIWDVESNLNIPLTVIQSRNVYDATWSPHNCGQVAVGSTHPQKNANRATNSVVRIFDISRMSHDMSTAQANAIDLVCPALDMNDVIYCPTDSHLISVGCTDYRAYTWDMRFPNKVLHVFEHEEPVSGKGDDELVDTGVRFLSWGHGGRNLYSGSSDGIVIQWDPYRSAEDAYIRDVAQLDSGIMSGSFSPDFTNLLLGDVSGTASVWSVGFEDRGLDLRQADKFCFREAVETKARLQDGWADTCSAADAAAELIESGQVALRPLGDFPKRQAVQGPAYVLPNAESITGWKVDDPEGRKHFYEHEAPKLRKAAARFQESALQNEDSAPHEVSADATWVNEADFGDSGAWKTRIPAEIRRRSDPELITNSLLDVCCFRCNEKQLMRVDCHGYKESDDVFICARCHHLWQMNILGFTPLMDLQSSLEELRLDRNMEVFRNFNVDESHEGLGNGVDEYYQSLWGYGD